MLDARTHKYSLQSYIPTPRLRAREAAQDQLEAARSRLSRLKDLERSKEALVSHYAALVPQGLDELSPSEKNQLYNMMNLRFFARPDGTLIADWGCNVSPLPLGSFRTRGR